MIWTQRGGGEFLQAMEINTNIGSCMRVFSKLDLTPFNYLILIEMVKIEKMIQPDPNAIVPPAKHYLKLI